MAVDKNLFLHDLSVVAIMYNEEPYVKEWLDYHLLAGVDHFYIYDHESTDNFKEILQPYIDAGIVTYTFFPGECSQMAAYLDAVHRFRFLSRYIAFIDSDEFIFPQNNKKIVEVVDEILKDNPNASGLVMNWRLYGSNNLDAADYSKGVLERFTRHAETDSETVKSITNPRKIKVFHQPHSPQYFEGCYAINENGGVVPAYLNNPPTVNKIVVNHYSVKSREEYEKKVQRGRADILNGTYNLKDFDHSKNNEVFDDNILKYRAFRMSTGGGIIQPVNYQKCYNALLQNLSLTFSKNTPPEIFAGKLETFFTCLKLAEVLREKVLNKTTGNFLEEAALIAIYKTLFTNVTLADLRLLFNELPNILLLSYPAVEDIRKGCINILPQVMNIFRVNNVWTEFTDVEYLLNMLKVFDKNNPA